MTIVNNSDGSMTVTLDPSDIDSLAWDMRETIEGSGLFDDAPDAPLTVLAYAVGARR